MKVIVKLFAAARQYCDCDQIAIELPHGATVQDLRRSLADAHPKLNALLPSSMIALDHDYAGDTTEIPSGAEVALIPPVSGG
jgi:molybdopterin synthase catalytic subunit